MTSIRITKPIRARLEHLEQTHGNLTASMVVADAKNKKSPLHRLFVWDVKAAAEQYWLTRAGEIIRNVRVLSSASETVVVDAPFYVRDPRLPPQQQGYTTIEALRLDPQLARQSLALEFSRVTGALERARSIAAAVGLDTEVEDLIARVVRIKQLAA